MLVVLFVFADVFFLTSLPDSDKKKFDIPLSATQHYILSTASIRCTVTIYTAKIGIIK